jgi:hypothetical protein
MVQCKGDLVCPYISSLKLFNEFLLNFVLWGCILKVIQFNFVSCLSSIISFCMKLKLGTGFLKTIGT